MDAINNTAPNTGKYSVANSAVNTFASCRSAGGTTVTFTAHSGWRRQRQTDHGTGNTVGVAGTAGTFTNAAAVATTDLAGGTDASVVHIGNQDYTFVNAAQFPTAEPLFCPHQHHRCRHSRPDSGQPDESCGRGQRHRHCRHQPCG